MAAQWGHNSLAAGTTAGWYLTAQVTNGFLPVISVTPLSPNFDGLLSMYSLQTLDSVSYPVTNALSASNLWSAMSPDGTEVNYHFMVFNFSGDTVEYAFVEAIL
jgi:hypothetical protein